MQRYNSSILDDILKQTLKYSGSSISSDELKIGVFFNKELLNMYLMKLAVDNHIKPVDVNKNLIQIALTKSGRLFIEDGGYSKQG